MRLSSLVRAVIGAALLVVPVAAHHSSTSYEMDKVIVLEGTVKQVVFLTPHSFFYVDVKDEKGHVVTWIAESLSGARLKAQGLQPTDLRPGERIRLRCHPLVDGSPGCNLGWVTPLHGDMARGHGTEKYLGRGEDPGDRSAPR